MTDKTKLDLDDISVRAHDLDEEQAEDITGGMSGLDFGAKFKKEIDPTFEAPSGQTDLSSNGTDTSSTDKPFVMPSGGLWWRLGR